MSNYKDKGWPYGVRRTISGAEYRQLVKTSWFGMRQIEDSKRRFDTKNFRIVATHGRPFPRRKGWLERVRARRRAAKLVRAVHPDSERGFAPDVLDRLMGDEEGRVVR